MTHTFDECMDIVRQHQQKPGAVDVVAIANDLDIRCFQTKKWKDYVSGMI